MGEVLTFDDGLGVAGLAVDDLHVGLQGEVVEVVRVVHLKRQTHNVR